MDGFEVQKRMLFSPLTRVKVKVKVVKQTQTVKVCDSVTLITVCGVCVCVCRRVSFESVESVFESITKKKKKREEDEVESSFNESIKLNQLLRLIVVLRVPCCVCAAQLAWL